MTDTNAPADAELVEAMANAIRDLDDPGETLAGLYATEILPLIQARDKAVRDAAVREAWQPIATAPRDEVIIGLRDPSATGRQPAFIGKLYDMRADALIDVWSGRWAVCTHWKPLDLPAIASGEWEAGE